MNVVEPKLLCNLCNMYLYIYIYIYIYIYVCVIQPVKDLIILGYVKWDFLKVG